MNNKKLGLFALLSILAAVGVRADDVSAIDSAITSLSSAGTTIGTVAGVLASIAASVMIWGKVRKYFSKAG